MRSIVRDLRFPSEFLFPAWNSHIMRTLHENIDKNLSMRRVFAERELTSLVSMLIVVGVCSSWSLFHHCYVDASPSPSLLPLLPIPFLRIPHNHLFVSRWCIEPYLLKPLLPIRAHTNSTIEYYCRKCVEIQQRMPSLQVVFLRSRDIGFDHVICFLPVASSFLEFVRF